MSALLLFPGATLSSDQVAARPSATELANANTVALVSAARAALHKLDHPTPDDDANQRKIYFDTAADSLTGLYQLHGCEWAASELAQLYARADAPLLRLGHSPDGRVLLRVEPLELLNPVYNDYCILMCSLLSQTERDYREAREGSLHISLPDGRMLEVGQLDPDHPLWEWLMRMAGQYAAPEELPSGAGLAFKQLYAIPLGDVPLNSCGLSLDWGGYRFELPRWAAASGGEHGSD